MGAQEKPPCRLVNPGADLLGLAIAIQVAHGHIVGIAIYTSADLAAGDDRRILQLIGVAHLGTRRQRAHLHLVGHRAGHHDMVQIHQAIVALQGIRDHAIGQERIQPRELDLFLLAVGVQPRHRRGIVAGWEGLPHPMAGDGVLGQRPRGHAAPGGE